MGTCLYFEDDKSPVIYDPVFEKIPTKKYFGKPRKALKIQRAFLVPRNEVLGDSTHKECIPNPETLKKPVVPPNYQENGKNYFLFYLSHYY